VGIPICSKFGLAHLGSRVKEAQEETSAGRLCRESDPGSSSFEVRTSLGGPTMMGAVACDVLSYLLENMSIVIIEGSVSKSMYCEHEETL